MSSHGPPASWLRLNGKGAVDDGSSRRHHAWSNGSAIRYKELADELVSIIHAELPEVGYHVAHFGCLDVIRQHMTVGEFIVICLSTLLAGELIRVDLDGRTIRSRRSFETEFGLSFQLTISNRMHELLTTYPLGFGLAGDRAIKRSERLGWRAP